MTAPLWLRRRSPVALPLVPAPRVARNSLTLLATGACDAGDQLNDEPSDPAGAAGPSLDPPIGWSEERVLDAGGRRLTALAPSAIAEPCATVISSPSYARVPAARRADRATARQ